MQSWAKVIPIEDVKDGQSYFVGKIFGAGIYAALEFHVRGLDKKLKWGGKPGISVEEPTVNANVSCHQITSRGQDSMVSKCD